MPPCQTCKSICTLQPIHSLAAPPVFSRVITRLASSSRQVAKRGKTAAPSDTPSDRTSAMAVNSASEGDSNTWASGGLGSSSRGESEEPSGWNVSQTGAPEKLTPPHCPTAQPSNRPTAQLSRPPNCPNRPTVPIAHLHIDASTQHLSQSDTQTTPKKQVQSCGQMENLAYAACFGRTHVQKDQIAGRTHKTAAMQRFAST